MSNCTSNSTSDLTSDLTSDPTSDPTSDNTNNPTSDPTSDSTSDSTSEPTIPSGPTSDPTSHPTKKRSTNREPLGDFRYCRMFDGYSRFGHFKRFGDFGIITTPVVFGFLPESALLLRGLSTEIPIEQRPYVESIPKAENSFQT